MSERCERCKKGYASGLPRDDLEWQTARPEPWQPGVREIRVARCTRCSAWLVDLWTTDADKPKVESHDVCLVSHEQMRAALVDKHPSALAAISSQLRRKHLELFVESMWMGDRGALDGIEHGTIAATETFRALVTWRIAVTSDLPPINDVRPTGLATRASNPDNPPKAPLDLGDGSRVVVEATRDRITLSRVRGDAVVWRAEIPGAAREGFVSRVAGRVNDIAVVAALEREDRGALVCLVSVNDGALRGPSRVDARATSFDARALVGGCTFVASYQSCAIVRDDATVAWASASSGVPTAVPTAHGAVVTDAPWRLVSLDLPAGTERWAIPIDRAATILASRDERLLLVTTDLVARLDVSGAAPTLAWVAGGASPLALASGGVALVRERWERNGRVIECVIVDPEGRRKFAVSRPDSTKAPIAEIANGVLLYHSASDVAVSVRDQVTYALSVPDRRPAHVSVEEGGAWIEFDGIVDRVDASGHRIGRWRVG